MLTYADLSASKTPVQFKYKPVAGGAAVKVSQMNEL
jgi:hypothetical protein